MVFGKELNLAFREDLKQEYDWSIMLFYGKDNYPFGIQSKCKKTQYETVKA